MPVEPPGVTERKRRAFLKALTSQATSKSEIEDAVSQLTDARITIDEYPAHYRLDVHVPTSDTSGTRDRLLTLLRQLVPAHLQVVVDYRAFIAGIGIVGSPLGPVGKVGTVELASTSDSTATKAWDSAYLKLGRGTLNATGRGQKEVS